jgi:hypothetical protein
LRSLRRTFFAPVRAFGGICWFLLDSESWSDPRAGRALRLYFLVAFFLPATVLRGPLRVRPLV